MRLSAAEMRNTAIVMSDLNNPVPGSEVETKKRKDEAASEEADAGVNDKLLVTGPALIFVTIGLSLAAFVTALDTSIVATVSIQRGTN
jgi:hypothetical protein